MTSFKWHTDQETNDLVLTVDGVERGRIPGPDLIQISTGNSGGSAFGLSSIKDEFERVLKNVRPPLSEIKIENSSNELVLISISKTFGQGDDRAFPISPGQIERWERAISGRCTIKVFNEMDHEIHRTEYGVVSPIGVKATWNGSSLSW